MTMVKRIAIGAQEVLLAMPPALAFDALCSMERLAPPGSAARERVVVGSGRARMLAFSGGGEGEQLRPLKEMRPQSPRRVAFRHLAGPLAGAVAEIELHSEGDGTRLVLRAAVDSDADASPWLQQRRLEHAVRAYLHCLEEALATPPSPAQPADFEMPALLAPLPALHTEQDLRRAVEAQEELEWGHAGHGLGVARVALALAEAALMPARQVDSLYRAALLHDAGKIAISGELWGAGTLDTTRRAMLEAHVRLGHDLALGLMLPDDVATTILYHHERWDGNGYPGRLAGETVPLRGRILALAEAVDTMLRATYRRPALSLEHAGAALEAEAGTAWDPMLARAAARILRGGKAHAG